MAEEKSPAVPRWLKYASAAVAVCGLVLGVVKGLESWNARSAAMREAARARLVEKRAFYNEGMLTAFKQLSSVLNQIRQKNPHAPKIDQSGGVGPREIRAWEAGMRKLAVHIMDLEVAWGGAGLFADDSTTDAFALYLESLDRYTSIHALKAPAAGMPDPSTEGDYMMRGPVDLIPPSRKALQSSGDALQKRLRRQLAFAFGIVESATDAD